MFYQLHVEQTATGHSVRLASLRGLGALGLEGHHYKPPVGGHQMGWGTPRSEVGSHHPSHPSIRAAAANASAPGPRRAAGLRPLLHTGGVTGREGPAGPASLLGAWQPGGESREKPAALGAVLSSFSDFHLTEMTPKRPSKESHCRKYWSLITGFAVILEALTIP